LAAALEAAAREAGVELRCATAVDAIQTKGGRVIGVVAGGVEIHAGVVVAGVDPKRVLTELVDPVTVGPMLRWRAGNIRTPGTLAKVNLVLSETPTFTAAAGDASLIRGRILITPGIDALERAHDDAKFGRPSANPVLEATIPSLVDPSLVGGAKPGSQVMSVIAQSAPYNLREGTWADHRDAFADTVVDTLDAYAPGLAASVVARQVLTPPDLEAEYGLTGGHPMHGEHGLDQLFLWRPLLGHARYRLAVDGLYLAGAGAHPGGGITGQNGQNAAREVLADWRRRR
jgi:phytoene dehydrogenase-like protein